MKYIIDNDIKVIDPNEKILRYCEEVLTIPNPDYIQAIKRKRNVRFLNPKLHLYTPKNRNTVVLPFGCLREIWAFLSSNDTYELKIKPTGIKFDYNDISLYQYQRHAVTLMLKAKNGVLQAPCGAGKTRMGLAIISELKMKALWLTHTHQLLEQTYKSAKELFGDINYGFITEGKVQIGEHITFATVQTLSNTDLTSLKNEFDVIIVDECHHCVGSPTKVKMFYKVLSNLSARYKYGLSATTDRSDGLSASMFALLGRKEYEVQKYHIGEKIIKADYVPVYIDKEYKRASFSQPDGTFDYTKLINTLSSDMDRNEIIVNKIIELLKEGRKQLVLCPRVAQVELISQALKINDVKNLLMTGKKKVPYDEMKKYNVIVATESLAKEGLDYQELDCVHLLSPVKNRTTIKQSVGRVERNVPNKRKPIVIDYVDEKIKYCVKASIIKRRFIEK